MPFYKGNNPWSKGKKLVQQKMEFVLCKCGCGNKLNKYDLRNRERYFLPFHFKSPILGDLKYLPTHKGKLHSKETKERISINRTGKTAKENNPAWKGGITSELRLIRVSKKYTDWRKSVFERDNYTCQHCNKVGGELNADHIKQFAFYPELRFDINNGRTLCKACHQKTPTYRNKIKPICK